jgi:hypothetical protein
MDIRIFFKKNNRLIAKLSQFSFNFVLRTQGVSFLNPWFKTPNTLSILAEQFAVSNNIAHNGHLDLRIVRF